MSEYFSLWTQVGLNKRAAAEQSGTQIPDITHMAVGDGGGSDVTPDKDMTALIHENGRFDVHAIYIDQDNPNWVWLEAKIPMAAGPWWIREVGWYDSAGDMVVVSNYPAVLKPTLSQGAGKDLYIQIVVAMENTSTITVTTDPSVVMASREYVDGVGSVLNQKTTTAMRRAFFYSNTM